MTPADYFKAMIFVAPALCSTICALFVALVLREKRGSHNNLASISLMALSLIICALCVTPLALGWSLSDAGPGAAAAIVAAAVTIPALQVWATWRIVRRGRPDREKRGKYAPAIEKIKNVPSVAQNAPSAGDELTKKRVEEYFEVRRPYLDPDFKLADLADAMDVNRSEMSAFVNRTFETGFKRYVNRWRLNEYDRLMALPSNELKNPYRVVKMAGFSDTRHYHRVVALEHAQEKLLEKITQETQ